MCQTTRTILVALTTTGTDAVTVCIVIVALVVTPEGLPLAYEMMPGNTADKTTLCDILILGAKAPRTGRARVSDRSMYPHLGYARRDAREHAAGAIWSARRKVG